MGMQSQLRQDAERAVRLAEPVPPDDGNFWPQRAEDSMSSTGQLQKAFRIAALMGEGETESQPAAAVLLVEGEEEEEDTIRIAPLIVEEQSNHTAGRKPSLVGRWQRPVRRNSSLEALRRARMGPLGWRRNRKKITELTVTSSYPTPCLIVLLLHSQASRGPVHNGA